MPQAMLARKLRVLRAERGLSLRKASELTGVDIHTISDTEKGKHMPWDHTLAKLAKGYGVPIEDLLEEPALTGAPGKDEAPQELGPINHVRMQHESIEVSDEVKADVRVEKVRQILRALDAGEITTVDADKAVEQEYTAA